MDTENLQRPVSYLVVRLGEDSEEVVVWDTLDITVGRLDSQDLVVPDPEVSRRHALFRRKGDRCAVEDLGTALGTLVNGEAIHIHELQAGDVVRIGMFEFEFCQTTRAIKPGENVRFASQLKGFGLPDAGGAAGRTMLAFDAEADLLSSVPTATPQVPAARAVTADGALEEVDEPSPLAPGDEDPDLGIASPVRDLDRELAGGASDWPGPLRDDEWAAAAPTRPPLTRLPDERAAPLGSSASGQGAAAPGALSATPKTAVKLLLEVEGPAAQVYALLAAVLDKRIEAPPLTLRVRDPSSRVG